MGDSNLPAWRDNKYSEVDKITGKYQLDTGFSGKIAERSGAGVSRQTCIDACNNESRCNSIGEDTSNAGNYRCWLQPHTQGMNEWFISATNHNIYFKNPKVMSTKPIAVDYTVQDNGPFADMSEASGGRAYQSEVTGVSCDGEKLWRSNYYLGATGNWWSKTDFPEEYGCPKIGIISGGDYADPAGPPYVCANPGAGDNYGIKRGTATCSYSKIYNKKQSGLPTDAKPVEFSGLAGYFNNDSDSNLAKAQESWCRSGGFDEIHGNKDCERIGTFDRLYALADLISETWYENKADCDRMRKLGILMNPGVSVSVISKFKDKLNMLPATSSYTWSKDVIGALNAIMNNANVIVEIKNAIKDKSEAYCNAKTNSGKNSPECGCKNAIEGWSTRKTGGCSGGTKGCDDVISYITAIDEVQKLAPNAGALMQFDSGFVANRDAQACIDGHAGGGDTVLAYMPPDTGAPQIRQLCFSLIQSLDQSTLSIKGNVRISCDQASKSLTANVGGGTQTLPGDPGDDAGDDDAGDDDEGDDTTTPASNNIWVWVIVGIFSLLLMLGFGASLLFLF